MKAIGRNVLLACLISTFAFFGALGGKQTKQSLTIRKETKQYKEFIIERQKETFACLSVAFVAWGLCFWRCAVINRRLAIEREYQRRFNDYMRNSAFYRQF
jgi:nucleosome binding factor SPN SPT16 subunit